MSNSAYEELQRDYQKLSEQYWNLKLSSDAQIEALNAENRKLRDESQGRGYLLIVLGAMLVFSVLLGFFVH